MYIQLISVHGLIRGHQIEMGRDADTGGQVRYVLELARTLAEFPEVDQVDLFTRQIRDKRVQKDYGETVEELGEKCRLIRLPAGGGKYLRKERLWPYLDDFVDALIAFTRKEGRMPDAVHGHYADAGYIAREVAAAFAAPFVFTGHSLGRDKLAYLREQGMPDEAINRDFNMDRRIAEEEACLAIADLVVVSTRHERDVQYARYANGRARRFEVIPPGTDLDRFFPYYDYEIRGDQIDELCKQARFRMLNELGRFHFQSQKPIILALSRPDRRKNITTLVEAYGRNKELQALANLAVFAGVRRNIDDMEPGEREVLTELLLLMDRYDLYGKMALPKKHDSHYEVPELYRLAASNRGVFVNTAFVEPFGLTFIESSAVGLPFVGTQNGGPQDIVENCGSGLIVNVENHDEIAAALRKLLTEPDFWERCSRNGINKVRELYTWKRHCERYLACLQEIRVEPSRAFQITVPESAPGQRLAPLQHFLITDIDNTLLGDDESLRQLLALIRQNRKQVGFGVASGRHLDSITELLRRYEILDLMDIIISSVGTEIYYGAELRPDKGWASHLKWKWRPDRVREALAAFAFLKLQADPLTQREFKISYDLDASVDTQTALRDVRESLLKCGSACSIVFSHGSYLDVLPHRASKGKAVRYLSGKWNIPIPNIITAGDSGNDRDMLLGGTAGIVVGNYDPELEDLRADGHRVFFAPAHCSAGILEGLRHYRLPGFTPSPAEQAPA